ncbi:MAG: hypothetical protein ACKO9A_17380, partial [Alphaproteobacteria bacterium]
MLDAASVSQINATAGAAAAAKARPAGSDDEGFQSRFREALEAAPSEEASCRWGAVTKPAENSQPDPETQGATQAATQPASAEATTNAGKIPATQAEDITPKASSPDAEGAVGAAAAAPEAAEPSPSAMLASLVVTQAQPKATPPDIPALAPEAAEIAAHNASTGTQAALTAAVAQMDGSVADAEARVAPQALASAMPQENAPAQQQVNEQILAQPPQQ